MLRITKATDPIQIKNIITTIYAYPGLGRTTLGYSADDPLLLDFDQAAHRAKNRGETVQIDRWSDVEKMEQSDFAGFKTVVVDTVGRALDHMTVKILAGGDPKNNNRAGGLSLQGYGVLKTTFITWLNQLRSYGLDVVLLAHMDEKQEGDTTKERLDIQGGSKNEVYKVSDLMGRYYMESRKRVLNFNPSDVAFGKNPAQLDPFDVPHYTVLGRFLGDIIRTTKDAINKLSAEQMEVQALLHPWDKLVHAAKTAADFNALIDEGKKLDDRIRENAKRILVKASRDLGLTFKDGAFVDQPSKADEKKDGDKPGSAQAAKEPEKKEEAKPADEVKDPQPSTDKRSTSKKADKKKASADQTSLPTGTERVPGQEG